MARTVRPEEFRQWAGYIENSTGIVLDEGKAYLLESRLGPLLEELGCADYAQLLRRVRGDAGGGLASRVVDAVTTHETSFFRDRHPFELLAHKILPDCLERSRNNGTAALRIWSVASSTGQEAYSIAMVIKDFLGDLRRLNVRILASDISEQSLRTASSGWYTRYELSRGLTSAHLRRHFSRKGEGWQINDELRAMVLFQRINLQEPPDGLGTFDVIFCRNVAIYFSQEGRRRLFQRLAGFLRRPGALILGSTESLVGIGSGFTRNEFGGKVYYEKRPNTP